VGYSSRSIRLAAAALAVALVAVALGIRLARDGHLQSSGRLEQDTGTALYAAVVYLGVVFIRPRINAYLAGVIALAVCWLVEAAQLTTIPATLSSYSPAIRLLVGAHFDWHDVAWYPVGIAPLVVIHRFLRKGVPHVDRQGETGDVHR
jgi:hypothetical protein